MTNSNSVQSIAQPSFKIMKVGDGYFRYLAQNESTRGKYVEVASVFALSSKNTWRLRSMLQEDDVDFKAADEHTAKGAATTSAAALLAQAGFAQEAAENPTGLS